MAYTYPYPHPAVTTDCCVFGFDGKDLQILLIQRREDPFKGQWAFPGGFLRMDETVDECALRELRSETHLSPDFLEQFHVFSDPQRDPRERVVTVAFLAIVPISNVHGGDDAAKARWFSVDKMPHLAFDHQLIYQAAREALKERFIVNSVGSYMLGEKFTMQELRYLYECVLGRSVDRDVFRRDMLSQHVVSPTDTSTSPTAPKSKEKLYSFAANSLANIKTRGSLE